MLTTMGWLFKPQPSWKRNLATKMTPRTYQRVTPRTSALCQRHLQNLSMDLQELHHLRRLQGRAGSLRPFEVRDGRPHFKIFLMSQ